MLAIAVQAQRAVHQQDPAVAHRVDVFAGNGVGQVVAIVGEGTWRLGCLIIGAFLGVGALTRSALPPGEAGLLQVRGKVFDVAALGIASLAIIALAIVVPGGR